MGAGSSNSTQKKRSPRKESDPSLASFESDEGMAEGGKPKDASKQPVGNEPWISKDEMKRYSSALTDLQEFLSKGKNMLDRQRKLESELATCHERLRRFTGDHARQSESNVENISSTNSPSSLERNYEQFYDHERMDAVEAIENSRIHKKRDKWTEIDDKTVACYIFEESFLEAQALRKSFLRGVSLILASAPAVGAQYSEAIKTKCTEFQFFLKHDGHQLGSLGQTNENSLKAIMKETAEICDTDVLVQQTLAALRKRQENGAYQDYTKDLFLNLQVKKYTEKCCKYAWKLVCQTPPYIMEGNFSLKRNTIFNQSVHQVCRDFTNSTRTTEYIGWIIWPGLFDGSGRVVRKTEVMLLEA